MKIKTSGKLDLLGDCSVLTEFDRPPDIPEFSSRMNRQNREDTVGSASGPRISDYIPLFNECKEILDVLTEHNRIMVERLRTPEQGCNLLLNHCCF